MDYPSRAMSVSTIQTDVGVIQVRDIFGEISRQYFNVCAMQLDDEIRAKLIELGWTPPSQTASS